MKTGACPVSSSESGEGYAERKTGVSGVEESDSSPERDCLAVEKSVLMRGRVGRRDSEVLACCAGAGVSESVNMQVNVVRVAMMNSSID